MAATPAVKARKAARRAGCERQDAGEGTTGDGGSQVGVTFNLPPGFFPSLSWQISGPGGVYSGVVYFGDAQSLEFVVGGIVAGNDYTIALEGTDRDGMPCSGTSAPFDVVAGQVSGAGVLLTCAGARAMPRSRPP